MKTAALAAAFTPAILWPALVNGEALLFYDSADYVLNGAGAWNLLGELLSSPTPDSAQELPHADGGPPSELENTSEQPRRWGYIRSIAYSAFAWPLFVIMNGPIGIVAAQAAISALIITIFVGAELPVRTRLFTMGLLAGLTPLPVVASQVMPDVFAGLAILVACLAVRNGAALGWGAAALLAALGGAAAAFHLSHLPLSLAVGVAGAAALRARRSLALPAALALLAAPVLAAGFNIAASAVAFDEPSVTPKRLPVVLARALADGPARRHVEAACAADPDIYAICEIVGTLPSSSGAILFGEGSFESLSLEAMERLRQEETTILARAAATEPLSQLAAFGANAAEQFWTFGLSDAGWSRLDREGGTDWQTDLGLDRDRTFWEALEVVHLVTAAVAALLLVAFAISDRLTAAPDERGLVVVLAVGLLANAAICGGLSAPADRYGARVIWVLPTVVALLAARRMSRTAVADSRGRSAATGN